MGRVSLAIFTFREWLVKREHIFAACRVRAREATARFEREYSSRESQIAMRMYNAWSAERETVQPRS